MCTTPTSGHKHKAGLLCASFKLVIGFQDGGHSFLLNFLLINRNISFKHCTCLFSVLYPKKPLANSLSFIIFYIMIKNSQSEVFLRKMCYVACPAKYVMHNRYECERGWKNVQRQCCSVNIPTENIADLDSQDLTLLWMLTLHYQLTSHFTRLTEIPLLFPQTGAQLLSFT